MLAPIKAAAEYAPVIDGRYSSGDVHAPVARVTSVLYAGVFGVATQQSPASTCRHDPWTPGSGPLPKNSNDWPSGAVIDANGNRPPGVVPSLIAFAVWGLAFGAVPPLLQTRLLQATPPRQRDAASALYTTAFNVGIGGGALVGAVLFERIGVQGLPLLYAVVLVLVSVVLVSASGRRLRQPRSTVAVETGPVRPSTV